MDQNPQDFCLFGIFRRQSLEILQHADEQVNGRLGSFPDDRLSHFITIKLYFPPGQSAGHIFGPGFQLVIVFATGLSMGLNEKRRRVQARGVDGFRIDVIAHFHQRLGVVGCLLQDSESRLDPAHLVELGYEVLLSPTQEIRGEGAP